MLGEISGFLRSTLQPAAGAHGEFTGVSSPAPTTSRAAITPAPRSLCRTRPTAPTRRRRRWPASRSSRSRPMRAATVDLEALRAAGRPDTAALMITNPNTLGLWDEHIREADHRSSTRLAASSTTTAPTSTRSWASSVRAISGIDIMHFNLHKTFSTPHGGGGPGSGPVGVREDLEQFLPGPRARRVEEDGEVLRVVRSQPNRSADCTPSTATSACTSAPIATSACTARTGLRQVSEDAVLAANYLLAEPAGSIRPAVRPHLHARDSSCPAVGRKRSGVRTLDIAKRLLDFGVHPPTTYFPLVVPEALMIEPTETESKESLDFFIGAMLQIADEVENNPELS